MEDSDGYVPPHPLFPRIVFLILGYGTGSDWIKWPEGKLLWKK
jgi:hypothetical protein